jgi:hypothetical protein
MLMTCGVVMVLIRTQRISITGTDGLNLRAEASPDLLLGWRFDVQGQGEACIKSLLHADPAA